jgi:Rrf2 family nitric oxide-sensitive transcriptional repressor
VSRTLPQAAGALPILSATVEYAFRALSELAALHPAETLRSADLAVRTGVPEAYLQKVLRRLVHHGFLRASKGRSGGFSLARPAKAVRFVDVLVALDAMPSDTRCAFGRPQCSAVNPCALHPAWSRLRKSVAEWAETTVLSDIVGSAPARRG